MNIVSDRDGLEMVCEHGRWTLYLVENDGREYVALGELYDHHTVQVLSEYLGTLARHANDNRPACQRTPAVPLPADIKARYGLLPDEDEIPF